eukprot:scaffold7802_cov115-Skeletonema_dohrnii-CCMP3373.AAC.1
MLIALLYLRRHLHLATDETRIFVSSYLHLQDKIKEGCAAMLLMYDGENRWSHGYPSGRLTWCCCMVMSGGAEESDDTMMFCASCGIAEVDDIKLKKCTACYLVKYCSVKCQRNHRPQHKRACKKRAAELRDEILFKQPESRDLGDCPI